MPASMKEDSMEMLYLFVFFVWVAGELGIGLVFAGMGRTHTANAFIFAALATIASLFIAV